MLSKYRIFLLVGLSLILGFSFIGSAYSAGCHSHDWGNYPNAADLYQKLRSNPLGEARIWEVENEELSNAVEMLSEKGFREVTYEEALALVGYDLDVPEGSSLILARSLVDSDSASTAVYVYDTLLMSESLSLGAVGTVEEKPLVVAVSKLPMEVYVICDGAL